MKTTTERLSIKTSEAIRLALVTRIDFCKARANECRPFPGEGLDADYWDAAAGTAAAALKEFVEKS